MAICGCGLSACCCQPAVAGGIIYADLRGELSTHLSPQALFTQSSSVCDATATSFPLPSTLGDTAPAFSGLCVHSQFTWEVGLPLSCGVFLPPPLLQAFPLLVAGPVPARPGLFIYSSVRDSPPHLFVAQGTPPSLLCVFIVLIVYYSVSLFFPGWGSVCPGSYADLAQGCLWKYRVPLSSPVVCLFPSYLGAGVWRWPRGPPGFSIQHEVGMLCAGWRCGGVKVLSLLSGLACKVCLQHLSKISL
jgi:hypothetical protein